MSERSGVARRGPGEHGASWAARVARRGGTLAALLLALALVPRAMPSVYAASTTAFQFTGAEQTFTVPAGVTTIHVIARGAPGGHGGYAGRAGGRGALVTGDLQVTPGQTLYVEVGGAATSASCVLAPNIPCHGGFNGGGTSYTGGGGGGASDVRTVSASQSGTLTSRLLVAAGGGGGADLGGHDLRFHQVLARQVTAALGNLLVFQVQAGRPCLLKKMHRALHVQRFAEARVRVAHQR